MRLSFLYLLCFCFATNIYGQSDSLSVKYNLFNPVPKNKMKEMQTDRPDITESAYTVEAGHFQLETDLLRFARNKNEGLSNTEIAYNIINLKMGLTQKLDMQFVLATFVNSKTKEINSNKIIAKESGFDDIILRLKYNVWGSSGGKSALAVMPYVSFPTSTFADNGIQGGIVIPFALELKNEWNFGTQVGTNIIKEDNRYFNELYYSFTFGKGLSERLSAFVEGFTSYSGFSKNTDVFFNGGIVYSVLENLNIDAGFNYGINKGTDKVIFIGLSFRL